MTTPVESPPPLWMLVAGSALFGLIAQLAASLAGGRYKNRAKLYGNMLLSLIISGCSMLVLHRMFNLDHYVAAAFATVGGAIPPLLALRASIQLLGERYNLNVEKVLFETSDSGKNPSTTLATRRP